MRLYLDTNILVFLLSDRHSLTSTVASEIMDYANTLYTSEVCVHELIHLFQIGKAGGGRRNTQVSNAASVLPWLERSGITVVSVTAKHLSRYAELPMLPDHRDPFDRLIIAQAMADRATLVTSDTKMPRYVHYGLILLYNER